MKMEVKGEVTFAVVAEAIKTALKGTEYANAELTEYGGGDGKEDIKPFLIARKGDTRFGATGFPEGGLLFWVWDDDGNSIQREFEEVGDAIAAFKSVN